MLVSSSAVFVLMTVDCASGCRELIVRPSASVTSCTKVGFSRTPPVRDRGGDLGHLHRRREQLPLPDRDAPDVDRLVLAEEVRTVGGIDPARDHLVVG